MKIGVVGGGPAGLYFALLMKKQNPAHEIRVVEQNPAGATYGWGVVFSDRALSYLAASDPRLVPPTSNAVCRPGTIRRSSTRASGSESTGSVFRGSPVSSCCAFSRSTAGVLVCGSCSKRA